MPSNTTGHNEQVEVIIGTERRRRYRTEDKLSMLEEAQRPGQTYSGVARKYGVSTSLMFLWRKQYEMGAFTSVKAGEEVVPASEFRAAQQKIRALERLLGKKTMENEILHEAVRIGREKNSSRACPCFRGKKWKKIWIRNRSPRTSNFEGKFNETNENPSSPEVPKRGRCETFTRNSNDYG